MMINNYTDELRKLPWDLTPERLVLEDTTMDEAPDSDLIELLCEVVDSDFTKHDPLADRRVIDAALALYGAIETRPGNATEGLSRTDVFGACLYQAIIWERG